ncbi:MAG: hypothetical protein L3J59_03615 [Methylococcaceae bacterium]|nr:hypothetical protein [Methylococcaceae bacterium]
MMKSNITILIMTLLSTSAQASLIKWDIQFFNGSGAQVGAGNFSYDPATTDTYTHYLPIYNEETYQVEATPFDFDISTSFTNLNWNVLGVNWSDARGVWWNGSNNHFGGAARYGIVEETLGHFIIGDYYFTGQSFELFFDPDSRNPNGISTATGNWTQRGDFPGSGTWNAQISTIPIPSVFLLFGSGLFSMVLLGRKTTRTTN